MPDGRIRVSRWNHVPSVRPVVNTDGDVLRKEMVRPAVFLSRKTVLERTVSQRRRRSYTHEAGPWAEVPNRFAGATPKDGDTYAVQCLCKVAGSERCPIGGHARRGVPEPEAWRLRDLPSGVRLVKGR